MADLGAVTDYTPPSWEPVPHDETGGWSYPDTEGDGWHGTRP